MKTIIHDLDNLKLDSNYYVVDSKKCSNSCIGCFSCWIKHPKRCLFKDEYNNMADKISKSDEVIMISESRYGCYSNSVKRVLERCIGYLLPYFRVYKGMIHHVPRFKNRIKLTVLFYGNIDENDKKCLYDLVKANCLNFNASSFTVKYYKNVEEIMNEYFN